MRKRQVVVVSNKTAKFLQDELRVRWTYVSLRQAQVLSSAGVTVMGSVFHDNYTGFVKTSTHRWVVRPDDEALWRFRVQLEEVPTLIGALVGL